MEFETIKYDLDEGVATITLNRPEALNAITISMLEEIRSAVKAAGSHEEIATIVITGEGRAFSAGLDLKDLQSRQAEAGDVGDIVNGPARKLIKAIRKSPKPIIAKVNGFCFTGALELALACDLIWVAKEAKLGDTHAKWGLRPTWGMSARLPNAIGIRKAKELSFTSDTFTGVEAAKWGLANCAVARDDLDASVKELTDKIAANSSGSIAAYKILYNKGGIKSQKASLAFEESFEYEIYDSADRLAEFTKND